MKKTAVMIIALIAAVSMCGCSGKLPSGVSEIVSVVEATADADTIQSSHEKAIAYIESQIDTSDLTPMTDDQDPEYLHTTWMVEEEQPETELGTEVTLGGAEIIIGQTTVKDLEELGFDVEKPAETAQADENLGVMITKDGKSNSISLMPNRGGDGFPVDDLTVGEVHIGAEEYTLPFDYQGMTHATSMGEVAEIFGMPNSSISVSSDGLETSIELSYFAESVTDGMITTDILSVYFSYDPDNDTAVLSGANISRSVHQAE